MYHGIILDKEFKASSFVNSFKIFKKRKSNDASWMLFGIEIEDKNINNTIKNIQENLKDNQPFYAHLYNGEKLIVIFKKKVFFATLDKNTWKEFVDFGVGSGIPKVQMNVSPVRFGDEEEYFKETNP